MFILQKHVPLSYSLTDANSTSGEPENTEGSRVGYGYVPLHITSQHSAFFWNTHLSQFVLLLRFFAIFLESKTWSERQTGIYFSQSDCINLLDTTTLSIRLQCVH